MKKLKFNGLVGGFEFDTPVKPFSASISIEFTQLFGWQKKRRKNYPLGCAVIHQFISLTISNWYTQILFVLVVSQGIHIHRWLLMQKHKINLTIFSHFLFVTTKECRMIHTIYGSQHRIHSISPSVYYKDSCRKLQRMQPYWPLPRSQLKGM